ncbi:MAG: hypothetical protein WCO56_22080 [Verrucomicrobiota bacterium]
MNFFPFPDPIPLPAPIWLFKALHILTLALHFVAVEILLGGLLVAVWLNFISAGKSGDKSGLRLNAAAALARRLPIVMTYVINLGVPPLLFAQVLYGRMLYTSSVLIGMWWISVIVLLTLCYWLLYKFAADAEQGKPGWWKGLLAWLIAGVIAKIYVSNMTLMIRPEVWADMYAQNANGMALPPSHPLLLLRWGYMLTGGLVVAGLWMLWISTRRSIADTLRPYLFNTGGRLALLAVVLGFLGFQVAGGQAAEVQKALAANMFYHLAGYGWVAMIVLVAAVGGVAAFAKCPQNLIAYAGSLLGFLLIACMVIYRDGIRDMTLLQRGYDVWDPVANKVVTNWSVVGIFLVSFVLGLVILGWLVSVMMRAKNVTEKVNP